MSSNPSSDEVVSADGLAAIGLRTTASCFDVAMNYVVEAFEGITSNITT